MSAKICPICGNRVGEKRMYCSVECKSKSQKKTIELFCDGCGIKFSILPYLKRKTNYCSADCYHKSTNKKVSKICPVCNVTFTVKMYLDKKGQGAHCSQECLDKSLEVHRKVQKCFTCGKEFKRAISLASKYKRSFCSRRCLDDAMREYVSITCANCQKVIQIPQSTINRGKGRFCSWYCYTHFKGETSIERLVRVQLQKAKIPFEQEVKIGKYHADFLISGSKVIIECDGDYWHSIPQAIKKDLARNLFLEQIGYKVVHFSETEIKRTKGRCILDLISS